MDLLKTFKDAFSIFLKSAYPKELPENIKDLSSELLQLNDGSALLRWPSLEFEDNQYALRVGNRHYPHMKIVFKKVEGRWQFYVDAHDSHFTVTPSTPGYDKLMALRQTNQKIKGHIEREWEQQGVPVFGTILPDSLPNQSTSSRCRVLAIDDEIKILDLLGVIVGSTGAQFERAISGADAIATIKRGFYPNIIFCDIMMPQMSGYEFIDWFTTQDIPCKCYYVTGLASSSIERRSVDGVLQKPFTVQAITSLITPQT